MKQQLELQLILLQGRFWLCLDNNIALMELHIIDLRYIIYQSRMRLHERVVSDDISVQHDYHHQLIYN